MYVFNEYRATVKLLNDDNGADISLHPVDHPTDHPGGYVDNTVDDPVLVSPNTSADVLYNIHIVPNHRPNVKGNALLPVTRQVAPPFSPGSTTI